MKKFIVNILIFFFALLLFFTICILLPTTKSAQQSFIFSKVEKDSLLKNVPSPRIVFIGGSNLCFGLNSQAIKDSMHLNPINTGINARIGLTYMLDHTLKYIKNGDIVVVIPEYLQYFGINSYGFESLLKTIMDVAPSELFSLNQKQIFNLYPYFPSYCLSKWNFWGQIDKRENFLYGKNSFNKYGDIEAQWKMPPEKFAPYDLVKDPLNNTVFDDILKFRGDIEKRGGKLFVSYPCYQTTSFNLMDWQILQVERQLIKTNLNLLGTAKRYELPDSLFFNTPYHLIKRGVDLRTNLLIEDLQHQIKLLQH